VTKHAEQLGDAKPERKMVAKFNYAKLWHCQLRRRNMGNDKERPKSVTGCRGEIIEICCQLITLGKKEM
jgi:hypothetical protein